MTQEQVPEPRKAGKPTDRQRSRLVRAIAIGIGMAIPLGIAIILFGLIDGAVVGLLLLALVFCVALQRRGPSHLRVRR